MKLSEWLALERGRGLALATAIGVSPVLISQWSTTRVPPYERCLRIERATDGAVTRRDLRPDDWCEMWPELAQALEGRAQAATETIAPTEASYTGTDRRQCINPPPADLERRAPLAAALAGGGV